MRKFLLCLLFLVLTAAINYAQDMEGIAIPGLTDSVWDTICSRQCVVLSCLGEIPLRPKDKRKYSFPKAWYIQLMDCQDFRVFYYFFTNEEVYLKYPEDTKVRAWYEDSWTSRVHYESPYMVQLDPEGK